MNYNVLAIPPFDRQLKRLIKNASLKQEFAGLIKSLEEARSKELHLATVVLKYACQLLPKAGGAGVITNFVVTHDIVYLLAIYDKGEKENLTDKELNELLKFVPE